jgi:hypothetical protein
MWFHAFLTWWCVVSFMSHRTISGKRFPGPRWLGGWLGPNGGVVDEVDVEKENLLPLPGMQS